MVECVRGSQQNPKPLIEMEFYPKVVTDYVEGTCACVENMGEECFYETISTNFSLT